MNQLDLRIYLAHAVFWLAFAAGDLVARYRFRQTASAAVPKVETSGGASLRAPRASLLIGVHMIAFALLYTGIERAVFHVGLPATPPSLAAAGAVLIFIGGALMCWARLSF